MMRAIRIDRPGAISYVNIQRPILGAGQVILKVRRVGYCGSDLTSFRGGNPLVTYPRIPGHEIAGEIVERADDVPLHLSIGEAVTVLPYTACGECASCRRNRANACERNQTLGVQRDGALTEFIAVPWQKIVQADLPLDALALVEPLSVGFHAVERGRIQASDTVLVVGCGMIGLGAIFGAAKFRGSRVIACDLAETKLGLAKKAGAAEVLSSGQEDFHEQLLQLTNGRGPDAVIEAAGAVASYQMAVREVAYTGRVIYIGYGKASVSYETKEFVLKELDILGSRNATVADFDNVIKMLRTHDYPLRETITRTVSWDEAGDALRKWSEDPASITKIQVALS